MKDRPLNTLDVIFGQSMADTLRDCFPSVDIDREFLGEDDPREKSEPQEKP